ncbi:MAG: SDR family oxidoreductase [Bacteroidetes bacterium]|jgi:short-subunit dehydrogenase|nr:SDR family oxidoreductase [Bacteroidota bacterium]
MGARVALITGASSGIGRALAIEAIKRGYSVGLMARSAESLAETAAMCSHQIQKSDSIDTLKVFSFIGDVCLENDCRNFIEQSLLALERIDVLINNAGISMRGIFVDTDLSVLKRLMDTNFWGTVYCSKYALPQLLVNKGSVVGISSIAGFKGLPARTGYSASKFAMQGFLESLRCENLETGLQVLIACPGYTESNIRKTALDQNGSQQNDSPLKEEKLMSAEAVAEATWTAIEKKRSYLILTLQGKMAVFINKWFPKLADRLTYNVIKKEPNSPFK